MRAIDLAEKVIARLQPVADNPEWITVWWDCVLKHWSEYQRRGDNLEQQISDYERRLAAGRDFPGVRQSMEASLPEMKRALLVWHGLVVAQATEDFSAMIDAMSAGADDNLWRSMFFTPPATTFIDPVWWETYGDVYSARGA